MKMFACIHLVLVFVISLCFTEVSAQTPPASNIYLGKITRSDAGVKVEGLIKVSDNPQYSNQPYFFDENTLYFTQAFEEGDGSQMDTMRYNIKEKQTSNVTNSTESEYSPTPTPDGMGFSVIKVNADNKQELWQIGFDGQTIQHLVPAIEPVGYHVWTRDDKLLLFVLGEHNTLVYANPAEPENLGVELAKDIGASLWEMPISMGYTYTIENEQEEVSLFWFQPNSGTNKRIAQLPKGAKYYAWSPRAELFTTDQGKLVSMPFIIDAKEIIYTAFTDVEIKDEACQKGISRIAISPYEDQIALVCLEDSKAP